MDEATKEHLLDQLRASRDEDEPLVEAIGDTIAAFGRMDSQEVARRVVDTSIVVLRREL